MRLMKLTKLRQIKQSREPYYFHCVGQSLSGFKKYAIFAKARAFKNKSFAKCVTIMHSRSDTPHASQTVASCSPARLSKQLNIDHALYAGNAT